MKPKGKKRKIILLIFLFWTLLVLYNQLVIGSSENNIKLLFFKDGYPITVKRDYKIVFADKAEFVDKLTIEEKATFILNSLLAGPTKEEQELGIKTYFPKGTKLLKVQVEEDAIYIELSNEFLHPKDESFDTVLEYTNEQIIKSLFAIPELHHFYINVEDDDGVIKPAYDFTIPGKERLKRLKEGTILPDKTLPEQQENRKRSIVEPRFPPQQPTGLLTGKKIGINPGHGWWFYPSYWSLQRPNIQGYIEDIGNWERSLMQLARYFWNAGAQVFPSREWSQQTIEIIVNNDSGPPAYTESGSWGYGAYSGYQTTYRYANVNSTATTATATWWFTVPKAGYYAVYEYHRPGNNRVSDVRLLISHSGGSSSVIISQKNRSTPAGFGIDSTVPSWIYLGTYHFDTGSTYWVRIFNFSQDPSGSVVIADAIRIGGGISSTAYAIKTTSTAMNKPWWQSAASYWTKYIGAPSAVWNWGDAENNTDWYTRPRHTIWEDCDVYLMIHTNAFDGSASGTRTYRHSSDTTLGTYRFCTTITYQIVNDVRYLWDSTWTSTSIFSGSYAELSYLGSAGIPGALLELAFHDNTTKDNIYLRNPKFNDILCRAIYKGVCRYFYSNPTILPLPPKYFRITNLGNGNVQLSWSMQPDPLEPTAVPTGYRVYRSVNGKGFDNGTYTTTTTIILTDLVPDNVYYFQVSAVNSGGESFPSETLCVRVRQNGPAQILIVNGFDRVDPYIGIDRSDPINTKVNQTFDYVIAYAKAISSSTTKVPGGKYYFDSASNEAVEAGLVNLNNYQAVIWLLGEESTADETFSSLEQSRVTTYLNNGGNLFVSGSEIGWDLEYKGSSADSTFYRNWLKADYVSDNAGTGTVSPTGSGIFAGLSSFSFDTGQGDIYKVDYPDVINPVSPASANLIYVGGSGGTAGIQYSGPYKLVYLAFPFETILSESYRNAVMQRILDFFELTDIEDWQLYQ